MAEFTPDDPEGSVTGPSGAPNTLLTKDELMWGTICHLSGLIAIWLGGLAFLGPLVCWLIKKDSSAWIDQEGKSALNFQLNIFIYTIIAVAIGAVTCGVGWLLLIPIVLLSIILPVIAGIKANSGEHYEYPAVIKLIH